MQDQLTLQADRPTVQATSPIREWTGRDALALRKALRVTISKFARSLDVSPRTVANWHASPATVPRSAAQDMLDELLNDAPPAVVERFERFTGHQAEPGEAPPGDLAALVAAARDACAVRQSGGQVVRLSSRPRYAAQFKPMSCGLVAEARTALGLTHAEFAALLESALGWMVMPETVGRWEWENVPPGDVVLFCQAALADARDQGAAGPTAPDTPGRDELTARRAARRQQ